VTDALKRLSDIAALRHTAELYAQGADRRDKSAWQRVLAPEIIIEGPGFRADGLDANLGSIDALGQMFRATQHRVSNQVVTISGDQAAGETYCTAEHLLPDMDALLVWAVRYQDRWRRSGDGWLFTHRTLIVDWQETRPVTLLES
jgi:hypothetical protein